MACFISSYLCSFIDSHLLEHPNANVVVCGDFNTFKTVNLEEAFDLVNKVNVPTRGRNVLDKVFVSSDIASSFDDCKVLPPLSTSDHNCVYLKKFELRHCVNYSCN